MRKAFFLLSLTLLMATVSVAGINCYGFSDDFRVLLEEAFQATVRAETAGGDVSRLVEDINKAINLLSSENVDAHNQAKALLESVLSNAPIVEGAGSSAQKLQLLTAGVIVSALLALTLLAWRFGSRLFWDLWLRFKRGWVLEKVD